LGLHGDGIGVISPAYGDNQGLVQVWHGSMKQASEHHRTFGPAHADRPPTPFPTGRLWRGHACAAALQAALRSPRSAHALHGLRHVGRAGRSGRLAAAAGWAVRAPAVPRAARAAAARAKVRRGALQFGCAESCGLPCSMAAVGSSSTQACMQLVAEVARTGRRRRCLARGPDRARRPYVLWSAHMHTLTARPDLLAAGSSCCSSCRWRARPLTTPTPRTCACWAACSQPSRVGLFLTCASHVPRDVGPASRQVRMRMHGLRGRL
jgi:hypothetical protein